MVLCIKSIIFSQFSAKMCFHCVFSYPSSTSSPRAVARAFKQGGVERKFADKWVCPGRGLRVTIDLGAEPLEKLETCSQGHKQHAPRGIGALLKVEGHKKRGHFKKKRAIVWKFENHRARVVLMPISGPLNYDFHSRISRNIYWMFVLLEIRQETKNILPVSLKPDSVELVSSKILLKKSDWKTFEFCDIESLSLSTSSSSAHNFGFLPGKLLP